MATVQALFDESAAALQFPYYFGENWNAFDECLNDFSWWRADQRLICVLDAASMLTGDEEGFSLLLTTFARAAAEWVLPSDTFRSPSPLHVILHAEEGASALLRARVVKAGLDNVVWEIRSECAS